MEAVQSSVLRRAAAVVPLQFCSNALVLPPDAAPVCSVPAPRTCSAPHLRPSVHSVLQPGAAAGCPGGGGTRAAAGGADAAGGRNWWVVLVMPLCHFHPSLPPLLTLPVKRDSVLMVSTVPTSHPRRLAAAVGPAPLARHMRGGCRTAGSGAARCSAVVSGGIPAHRGLGPVEPSSSRGGGRQPAGAAGCSCAAGNVPGMGAARAAAAQPPGAQLAGA